MRIKRPVEWRISEGLRLVLLIGATCLSFSACQETRGLSIFAVQALPATMRGIDWIELARDAPDDGVRPGSADGRALSYHYDAATDTLWFRLELYGQVDTERPAVSVSIDVDADQDTGIPWYGANSGFTFDKMLSVGPLEPAGGLVRGYNGITNADGVARGEWINERSGVLTFFVDAPSQAYVLGVARTDIATDLWRFHVIGSVGENARWNDDIGEEGHATIQLDPNSGPVTSGPLEFESARPAPGPTSLTEG